MHLQFHAGTHIANLGITKLTESQTMKNVILALGLALGATAANAGTWKCGNSYQDHPCQASPAKKHDRYHHEPRKPTHGQGGGTVTPTPAPTPPTTPAPAPTPTPTP